MTQLPIGSLQPVHWAQAEGLFKSLHRLSLSSSLSSNTNASSSSAIHNKKRQQQMRRRRIIVHDSFAILDRLSQEVVAATTAATTTAADAEESNDGRKDLQSSPTPCDVRMLGSVVGAWRQALRAQKSSDESNNNKTRVVNNNNENDPALYAARQVLDKVERYAATGLFVPNRMIYTSIIHAIGHGGNNNNNNNDNLFEAALLAEQVVEGMRARANYNPNDKLHHPNRDSILNLMHRWAQAATCATNSYAGSNNVNQVNVVEPARKAQDYLELLQSWYQATQRPDMRPDTRAYAAAITAWGNHAARFHHGTDGSSILARIKALIDEMNLEHPLDKSDESDNDDDSEQDDDHHYGANGDDPYSLPAYNAICHALAQTRQPGAGQLAHDILNQLVDNYQQHPNTHLKPNAKTFGPVISAYGRTRMSAHHTLLAFNFCCGCCLCGYISPKPVSLWLTLF